MNWKKFFSQMRRAAKLDRRVYAELLFDDYATANAVMVVAFVALLGVALILAIGQIAVVDIPNAILGGALSALWGWIISAGGFWLAGTKLFHGEARFQTVLRMIGFAYITLSLVGLGALSVFSFRGFDPIKLNWVVLASLVWFGLSLHQIAQELFDIRPQEQKVAAFLGVAAWLAARFIF